MALSKRVATEAQQGRKAHKNGRAALSQDVSTRRVTRAMTTDAARQAVFNTSELLERIIVHLPIKSIFVIQRVSQKFKAVIDTSPDIQTKLFLRLQGAPSETWTVRSDYQDLSQIPSDIRFQKVDAHKMDAHRLEASLPRKPVALNPLLELRYPSQPAAHRMIYDGRESIRIGLREADFETRPSFWKMYITDPPCHGACAEIISNYPLDDPTSHPVHGEIMGAAVQSAQGLTIADVLLGRGDVGIVLLRHTIEEYMVKDAQLHEVMQQMRRPIVERDGLYPDFQLQLLDVVVPTDEERNAAYSEAQDDASLR